MPKPVCPAYQIEDQSFSLFLPSSWVVPLKSLLTQGTDVEDKFILLYLLSSWVAPLERHMDCAARHAQNLVGVDQGIFLTSIARNELQVYP